MVSPFPGMNPYLEHPELFPGLHHLLISEIARFLSPRLRPKYRVAVEVRMYETTDESSLLVGIPDVSIKSTSATTSFDNLNVALATPSTEPARVILPMPITIREGYLEVKEVATEALITTIEILSAANKRSGKGRKAYEEKREEVLRSRTNLVEIDLLRKGQAMPFTGNTISSDYRILICRGQERPYGNLYAFNLQNVIPAFSLPLRPGDTEPTLDLQELLNSVYDIYDYDLVVDYSKDVIPSLSPDNAAWLDELLREKGLR